MPGFTAPKLIWVAKHEPEVFARVATVLLPKDYLRLRLTGEKVSDMSDAAGTLWLDVARRDWSDVMLEGCRLSRAHMPRLVEGSAPSGRLLPDIAASWGIRHPVIVAGGAATMRRARSVSVRLRRATASSPSAPRACCSS